MRAARSEQEPKIVEAHWGESVKIWEFEELFYAMRTLDKAASQQGIFQQQDILKKIIRMDGYALQAALSVMDPEYYFFKHCLIPYPDTTRIVIPISKAGNIKLQELPLSLDITPSPAFTTTPDQDMRGSIRFDIAFDPKVVAHGHMEVGSTGDIYDYNFGEEKHSLIVPSQATLLRETTFTANKE